MSVVDLDSEKQELDAMVERLARSPRLAHLLRYLGDRYLRGDVSMLREFEIATEVFGRPQDFDPGEDAIARVEAHRLRKKLKLYYETEGRDNPVRITIPSGSYTPVFTHRILSTEIAPTAPPVAKPIEPVKISTETIALPLPDSSRWWIWVGLSCALACVLSLVGLRQHPKANVATVPGASAATPEASVVPSQGNDRAVRIVAGYTGQPHIDMAGHTWEGDRFFTRGGPWRGATGFTGRTNDEFLYRTVRTGEFEYNIPLAPGTYEMHLFFDETGFGPGIQGGEGDRTFNVLANHQTVLTNFDILSDAMGPNLADEKVFRDIQPGSDGKLNLELQGVSGKPIINGVEIVPGLPHRQLPIRLTAQRTPVIDRNGNVWEPDNYFLGGQSSLQKPPVTGTADPELFGMERYGHFSYAIPVDVRDSFTVTLYFAEFYYGPDAPGAGGIGNRRFNVYCNGTILMRDFDIFREAGSLRAVTKTFRHIKASPQGKLNLVFEPIANYANISAIEVLDEGQP